MPKKELTLIEFRRLGARALNAKLTEDQRRENARKAIAKRWADWRELSEAEQKRILRERARKSKKKASKSHK